MNTGEKFSIPGWAMISEASMYSRQGISDLWNRLQYAVNPIYYNNRTPYTGSQGLFKYVQSPSPMQQITISKVHNIANYSASTLTSFLIPAFEREIVIEPMVQISQRDKKWFQELSRVVAELLKSPVTDLSNVVHSCLLTALHYGNCCLRITAKDGIFSLAEQDIYDVFIDLDYETQDISKILLRHPSQDSFALYDKINYENVDHIWEKREGSMSEQLLQEPLLMNEIVYARFKRDVGTCYGTGPGIQNISLIERIGINLQKLQKVASYQAHPAIVNYLTDQKISFNEGTVTTLTGNMGTFVPGGVPTALIQKYFSDDHLKVVTSSYISDLKDAYYSEVAMMPESPNMTAAEVGARMEEKIGLLHPTVQNLQKELIYPIIMSAAQFVVQESRKANFRNTYLKQDAPVSVKGLTRSQIRYTSRFELMARRRHAEGLNVLTQAVAQAAAINPDLRAILDVEKFLGTFVEAFSLDSELLKGTVENQQNE